MKKLFSFIRVVICVIVISFIVYFYLMNKGGQFGTFEWIVFISLVIGLILELVEIYREKKEANSA